MANTLRKPKENDMAQFPKLSVVIGQKSMLHNYHIQTVKDRIVL